MTDAYFSALGDGRYQPSMHAQGAWSAEEIHFAPLGGLLVHAIERHRTERGSAAADLGTPQARLALSRVTFDILGFLALDECTVRVETVRPGRTIELVQATVAIRGRDAAVARAWWTVEGDAREVAGGGAPALPPPGEPELWRGALERGGVWPGGFVHSVRMSEVTEAVPGRATVWVTSSHELVEGESVSQLARWLGLIDLANGVAVRQEPTAWMFPNVDLTIHLDRQPEGPWVGLDTTVRFGPGGQGTTSTMLHDERGQVGSAAQALTVRRAPRG